MDDDNKTMSIEDLAETVGVSVRTVRFYITEGLLPGPEGRGKAASYDRDHLLRLQLIRRLSEQRVPLAGIQRQIAVLSTADIEALLSEEEKADAELQVAEDQASPREYVSALLGRARQAQKGSSPRRKPGSRGAAMQEPGLDSFHQAAPAAPAPTAEAWERWELAPGIELHVRKDAARRQRKLIDRILELARDWTKPWKET